MKRFFSASTGILLIVLLAANTNGFLYAQNFSIPDNPFPGLTGPYQTGTHEYYWIDETRSEKYTKDPDDKRHLLVQVWYPAEQNKNAEKYPYIARKEEFGDFKGYEPVYHVKTNSVLDAGISAKLKKYPVLIFSHGMGNTRFSNTYQTEMLASHGYIVFAVNHTFENNTTVFPDGFSPRKDNFKKYERIKGNPEEVVDHQLEYYDNYRLREWEKDASFVLDKIAELNKTEGSFFKDRLDLDKTGMFGYSFGGSNTVKMCKNDSRIKAAVNMDSYIFGDVWETGITQPIIFIRAEIEIRSREENEARGVKHENYLKTVEKFTERESTFFRKSKNDKYVLTLKNTVHRNFSDNALFRPQNPDKIDNRKCHEIINAYTLAFFDKYLKNKDNGLLKKIPGIYPEAVFMRK